MNKSRFIPLIAALLFIFPKTGHIYAADTAIIESFSPQGTVKGVRQVSVRFSEQMVPFGDPRLVEPFEINCQEMGRARWADGRSWIYDFDKDIPAGVVCSFKVKEELKTLSGKEIGGRKEFEFSTGGPAVKQSSPWEGAENIDEEQIFILTLDAEPVEETVLANVSFSIEGIKERIGVRIITGEELERVLKTARRYDRFKDMPVVVLQCRQRFPNNARVNLIWGKGVKSLSSVETAEDQVLPFRARGPFAASFSCERENAQADCIPILPMHLNFSSPVLAEYAKKIVMKGSDNTLYKPSSYGGNERNEGVSSVTFDAPFPEKAAFFIDVPREIKDDAGRGLSNIDNFPLTVKTDAYPPLAKFSARFGIIELKGDATLPVTLRNLEPQVKTRTLKVEEETDVPAEGIADQAKKGVARIGEAFGSMLSGDMKERIEGLKGKSHKVVKEEDVIEWLKKAASARRYSSTFSNEQKVNQFTIPKPNGAKAFEVVGIPLKEPGLYVVEMESQILGSSLLGRQAPMYVPTAALVTNLSAHFKWGRESSLVWVTTLDKAEPVKDAVVTIRNCKSESVWQGKTDAAGIAAVNIQLPYGNDVLNCTRESGGDYYDYVQSGALNEINSGLFVFAKAKDDMTFTHSSWDNGIEPWRYQLPGGSYRGPFIAHSVFDRSLLRAGETVSMKHFIRRHNMAGFSFVKGEELPKAVLIQHGGSNQRYEFSLKWDGRGIAETVWKIPQEAKLGTYEVTLLKKAADKAKERTAVGGYEEGDEGYFYPDGWLSGSFRVEEFRVPLMKGIIQPPKEPLVNVSEAQVDLLVKYLSGGGAGGAGVKLRSQVQPRYVNFNDYEGYIFANGEVKEGVVRSSGGESEEGEGDADQAKVKRPEIISSELVLDPTGSLRTKITGLPKSATPQDIQAELEFKDPNGEVQTVSARIPLWSSRVLVGVKPDSWAVSKEAFKFHIATVDVSGRPAPDKDVKVELFERKYFSHRKRLVGGFYSYEHVSETKRIGAICEGKTNQKGVLTCEVQSPVSGNVILQAVTADNEGNPSTAYRDVWIAGKGEWWFDVTDNDRIDILPEKKRYEPGETAKFQVRMPFREATALVTVEREGVMERFVKRLSGKSPVVEIPIKNNYAPNVFVSVLCVRGRVGDIQSTALVDLGRPAYKLGIAEIKVGWKAHELKVKVSSDRDVYKIREKARVKVEVKKADGTVLPKGSEVAIAAVDEGLLELMPNQSWKLLDAMMGRRGYEVRTATAQMQVVGKRHYGLKALPHGGGGGRQVTREMFDTLLLWKGRVFLDEKGEAVVEIPLNDSLTSFKIVAVASSGAGLFGTGETSIRTTQDLMLLSGLPLMVREGDRFRAGVTVRNASDRKMEVEVSASLSIDAQLEKIIESLGSGEAKEVGWDVSVPVGIDSLTWEVIAKEKEGSDRMKVRQKVVAAVPVRTFQATITQVDKPISMNVERPADALPSKGGVSVSVRARLSNGLGGVTHFMKNYPYTCMEQKVSRAVALRDEELWKKDMAELPSHMDSDGLIKYFPTCRWGSDTLTAYILAIAHEAGWEIPESVRTRMEEGLIGFINGRVIRWSSLPTADVSIRKMAALEALSRYGKGEPGLLGSIDLEPNLWPTSAVIDWMNLLMRVNSIPDRQKRFKEAEQILRSRLNFQGTTMGFSTEGMDNLWWLMVSTDVNSVRAILTFLDLDIWKEDMPRLVRGALGRQYHGAWNLTTANAWGVLAMEKFSNKFESVPVTGTTSAKLSPTLQKGGEGGFEKSIDWGKTPKGDSMAFGWPKAKEDISIFHEGTGRPWATIQSLAAIPLKEGFSSGYKIKKSLSPIEQKQKGKWSRGDVIRVRLELESQADMTWVVVNDPVPAGSSILGTGLGRDSQILTGDEKSTGWVWPVFEERSFEAFRAYYEFVPKGKWTVEYTVRLNNEGTFNLPETRVEALYAPEMFGEIPNRRVEVER